MEVYRDPTAVVFDRDGVVFVDDDVDGVAVPAHGLIYRVVDYFVDQVVEPPGTHVANVHGGAHPYVFNALKGLNTVGGILFILCFFAHC
jgi:hypothetical protein